MKQESVERHFAMLGALRGELLSIRMLRNKHGQVDPDVYPLLWKWLDSAIDMLDEDLSQIKREVLKDGNERPCHD